MIFPSNFFYDPYQIFASKCQQHDSLAEEGAEALTPEELALLAGANTSLCENGRDPAVLALAIGLVNRYICTGFTEERCN